MTTSFKKFRLLMWKNYRLRRFHWILTLIELILPMLVAYGLTKITSSMNNSESSIRPATYRPEIPREKLLLRVKYFRLVYAPSNGFTDSLMNQVQKNFENCELLKLKSKEDVVRYISTYNETDTTYYYNMMGVIFHDIVSDQVPDKLNYSLRDTNRWNTNNIYVDLHKPGPQTLDQYYALGFAGIQMVINDEFTYLKTKQTPWTTKTIVFQPFPYPEYQSNGNSRAVVIESLFSLVVLTVMIISVPLIKDIIEEKESGVKELMKLTGLQEWTIWLNWFIHALIVSAISYTIVAIILKYPINGDGSEAIHFVTFTPLWITLIMYCIANIAYCFMFCAIFHRANVASAIFLISVFTLTMLLSYMANSEPGMLQTLLCFFPVGAFRQGFFKITYFEIEGIQFTWSSITLVDNESKSVSLLFSLIMLLFDTFLYLTLASYITAINPGKFGARKSPFFIFKCFSSMKNDHPPPIKILSDEESSEYIEVPPPNMEATIQIKDLYKNFGSFYAVNDVNLNIYKGEITALLGHNGAGKTTTMSILTGLTSPSAGSIYYRDINIFERMNLFRENLGMCPQEDRLFPYLTVLDHLLFFGMLKGASEREATREAEEYLSLMELESKKTSLAKELSGGMKRKLCLAISLMGKADTLILDEPTSGMDVQSRRKIWDLLLEMRGNRTIILTTHYMEEADALGDRVAIMHHGSIVCHGTPIFLKKAYGTGYELTITKEIEGTDNLTHMVKSIIPNSTKENQTANEVVYKLPLTETIHFPNLFRNLEANKSNLGIMNMGMACTTMEHVFLKVGGVSVYDSQKTSNGTTVTDAAYNSQYLQTTEGLALVIQQIGALFHKKFLYTRRNLFALFTRIALPTIVAAFLLSGLQSQNRTFEPPLNLDLHTYPDTMIMLQKNDPNSNIDKLFSNYASQEGVSVLNSEKSDILEGLLTYARQHLFKFNKNLITAFEFNTTSYKVLYNLKEQHSFPIAINTYSNVMLRNLLKSDKVQISIQNFPIVKLEDQSRMNEPNIIFYILWFIGLAFYTVDLLAYFTGFINIERLNGFKHIQMMSNVSPMVYWLGTFAYDFIFFILIFVLRISLFKIFDYLNFLTFSETLGVLTFLILLTGISGLLFIYVTSFLSSSKDGSYTLLLIVNAISGIIVAVYYLFETLLGRYLAERELEFSYWILLFYVTKYVILLTPQLNFFLLFIKIMKIWTENTRCNYGPPTVMKICEETFEELHYMDQSSKNPSSLFLGIGFLIFDIVLYAVILTLINGGYFSYWFNKWKILIYGDHSTNEDTGDSDVQQEYQKVQSFKNNPILSRQAALLVDGLRKNYIVRNRPLNMRKLFKPFSAVADVNFVVVPGECFGLLGVNGAGKTTTFKMLTTDVLPTKGDAAIEGIRLSINKESYMSMAGYCAQTNCFIEELTGREMLRLIASLRGVRGSDVKVVVNKWISILGLEDYQYQNCGSYSGGNKRKLCTAMSLIGDPRVVFLDEPTSGVDPVSRRKLYDVMGQSKEAGQAVVLTSHSMEECETLCDRLTIMAAGVMKCIGTAQHLKKRYAQGFSLLIKIRDSAAKREELDNLKSGLINVFSSRDLVLKDEHRGLLYYQIKDTNLQWSTLFERMEDVKNRHHDVVDDYVLTDTTLEEVFISFAKPDEEN